MGHRHSLSPDTRIWRRSIELMAKHLPPSGAELHLLDFSTHSGHVIQALHKSRPDIVALEPDPPALVDDFLTEIEALRAYLQHIALVDNSVDAITAHSTLFLLDESHYFLAEALRVLRPGGRLILFDPADEASKSEWAALKNIFTNPKNALALFHWHRTAKQYQRFTPESIAKLLEVNGFVRILAERILDGWGILSRGEKPYAPNTPSVDRVAIGARDINDVGIMQGEELLAVKGRFIHLLIHQTPNIPIWQTKTKEIEWKAAAVSASNYDQPIALAFTSLPKAVSFMQSAIMDGYIQNINKIAKFNKDVASQWGFSILLNPTINVFQQFSSLPVVFLLIDPLTAETPDE